MTVIVGPNEVLATPAAEGTANVVVGVTITVGLKELLTTPATDGAVTVVVGVTEIIGLRELLNTPPFGVGNTVDIGVIVTTGAKELLTMPLTGGAATVEVGVIVTTGLMNEMLDTEALNVGELDAIDARASELTAFGAPAKVEVDATTEATGATTDPTSVATVEDECEMSGDVTNGVTLAGLDKIGVVATGVETEVVTATGGELRDVTANKEIAVDKPVLDCSALVLDAILANPDTSTVNELNTPPKGCKPADDAVRVLDNEAAAADGDDDDAVENVVELGLVSIEDELTDGEEPPADPELVVACPKGDSPSKPPAEGTVPRPRVLRNDAELKAIELTLGNVVDRSGTELSDIELSVGIVAEVEEMELNDGVVTDSSVIEVMVESDADDNEIELRLDNVTDASEIELVVGSDADVSEIELKPDNVMLGARPFVSCAEDMAGVLIDTKGTETEIEVIETESGEEIESDSVGTETDETVRLVEMVGMFKDEILKLVKLDDKPAKTLEITRDETDGKLVVSPVIENPGEDIGMEVVATPELIDTTSMLVTETGTDERDVTVGDSPVTLAIAFDMERSPIVVVGSATLVGVTAGAEVVMGAPGADVSGRTFVGNEAAACKDVLRPSTADKLLVGITVAS